MEGAFRDSYRAIFGIALENPVEAIVLRTGIRKPLPRRIKPPVIDAEREGEPLGNCRLYSFARRNHLDAATQNRASLTPGVRHRGPAVIYEETATTYVDADYSYGMDENGCLVLTKEGLMS